MQRDRNPIALVRMRYARTVTGTQDSALRAITDDGSFRVIVARTTDTVRQTLKSQGATGATARHFGDLLTGSVLFRETMAPQLRVQGIIKGGPGGGSLVADSHPSGNTRGLIQLPEGQQSVALGEGSRLRLMRTLPDGRLNQGVVEVPKDGGISSAFMAYMQTSEQVVSMLAVGTHIQENEVLAAGGYLVQLLPEAARGAIELMTHRLEAYQSVDRQLASPDFSPSWLLTQLLEGVPFTQLEESDVRFGCWCTRLRLLTALTTLSRSELEAWVADGEILEISCDYCKKQYAIPPVELQGLLEES